MSTLGDGPSSASLNLSNLPDRILESISFELRTNHLVENTVAEVTSDEDTGLHVFLQESTGSLRLIDNRGETPKISLELTAQKDRSIKLQYDPRICFHPAAEVIFNILQKSRIITKESYIDSTNIDETFLPKKILDPIASLRLRLEEHLSIEDQDSVWKIKEREGRIATRHYHSIILSNSNFPEINIRLAFHQDIITRGHKWAYDGLTIERAKDCKLDDPFIRISQFKQANDILSPVACAISHWARDYPKVVKHFIKTILDGTEIHDAFSVRNRVGKEYEYAFHKERIWDDYGYPPRIYKRIFFSASTIAKFAPRVISAFLQSEHDTFSDNPLVRAIGIGDQRLIFRSLDQKINYATELYFVFCPFEFIEPTLQPYSLSRLQKLQWLADPEKTILKQIEKSHTERRSRYFNEHLVKGRNEVELVNLVLEYAQNKSSCLSRIANPIAFYTLVTRCGADIHSIRSWLNQWGDKFSDDPILANCFLIYRSELNEALIPHFEHTINPVAAIRTTLAIKSIIEYQPSDNTCHTANTLYVRILLGFLNKDETREGIANIINAEGKKKSLSKPYRDNGLYSKAFFTHLDLYLHRDWEKWREQLGSIYDEYSIIKPDLLFPEILTTVLNRDISLMTLVPKDLRHKIALAVKDNLRLKAYVILNWSKVSNEQLETLYADEALLPLNTIIHRSINSSNQSENGDAWTLIEEKIYSETTSTALLSAIVDAISAPSNLRTIINLFKENSTPRHWNIIEHLLQKQEYSEKLKMAITSCVSTIIEREIPFYQLSKYCSPKKENIWTDNNNSFLHAILLKIKDIPEVRSYFLSRACSNDNESNLECSSSIFFTLECHNNELELIKKASSSGSRNAIFTLYLLSPRDDCAASILHGANKIIVSSFKAIQNGSEWLINLLELYNCVESSEVLMQLWKTPDYPQILKERILNVLKYRTDNYAQEVTKEAARNILY